MNLVIITIEDESDSDNDVCEVMRTELTDEKEIIRSFLALRELDDLGIEEEDVEVEILDYHTLEVLT